MIFNIPSMILLITCLCNFIIGVYVIFQGLHKKLNLLFGIFMLQIAIWNVVNLLSFVLLNSHLILLFDQLALFSVFFIPSTYLLFIFKFIGKNINRRKIIYLFFPSLLMVPFTFTKYNIAGFPNNIIDNNNFIPGILYFIYIIYFILFIGYGIFKLFQFYNSNQNTIQHYQAQYILWGVLITGTIDITTNAILPLISSIHFNIYGTPASIIFGLVSAYAITRYQFLDIHTFWHERFLKVVAIIVSSTFFTVIIILLILTHQPLLVITVVTFIICCLMFALAFYVAQHYFTRPQLDFSLSPRLNFTKDTVARLSTLNQEIITVLREHNISNAVVCSYNWQRKCFQPIHSLQKLYLPGQHALVDFLKTHDYVFDIYQAKSDLQLLHLATKNEILDYMHRYHFQQVIGLHEHKHLYGLIFFTAPEVRGDRSNQMEQWQGLGQKFGYTLQEILNYEALTNPNLQSTI